MVQERSDWCISRQRSWGLPIPVFYYRESGDVFINEDTIKKIIDIFNIKGSSAWWELNLEDLLPDQYKDQADSLVKGEDTLDVWFDSGSSWKAVLIKDNNYPADLYLEGNDQHRGWFQSSLLTSVSINQTAPYKAVLTHGFVVDGKGQKMSKSRGNVFDPDKIIKQHGADILRLWVASEDYSSEVRISDDILSSITDKYKKIRNTLRFLLGNLYDFNIDESIDFNQLEEIDKWILARLSNIKERYNKYFGSYLFHLGLSEIINFCSNDLSSIYLDIQKDVLYTYSQNSKERKSSQTAISLIFKEVSLMLAPVLSFTIEEAWKANPLTQDSVFIGQLSDDTFVDLEIQSKWDKLLDVRDQVLKEIEVKRKMKIIGNSLEAKVGLTCDDSEMGFLNDNLELIKKVLIVSELNVSKGTKKDLEILIEKTTNEKCQRCWMYYDSKNFSKSDKNLCKRCEEQLKI
jgi:isoleucyl-tRNA synthetase